MFEKFTRSAIKGAVEDAKRTFKEEVTKSADDILPMVFGGLAVALLLVANVPPQKLPKQAVASTIINFYF